MDTEDGQLFIKNLASFVKTHEKALANALQQHQRQNSRAGNEPATPTSPITPFSPHPTSSSLISSFPFLGFGSRHVKSAKLCLTPHHLFYLLTRFQELGVTVGPMDIRLENIHSDSAPGNYVSFLNQAQRRRIKTDRDSIHSVSSIRSVMSTMSSLWTRLGLTSNSEAKTEKQKLQIKEDMKYLYSAFTKVPCLKLSPDHKAPLISGYEEFPFDSAVPLLAFKNVTQLEICDVDFRQFYGWDYMAENLRSLTIKRGNLDDPSDLLVNIVLDDMDRRRRRSAKVAPSPILPWSAPSPSTKHAELARSPSDQSPPNRPTSMSGSGVWGSSKHHTHRRQRSVSPTRPPSSRQGSSQSQSRSGTPNHRRSSASSESTDRANTPRGSSANLLASGVIPASKWRFLRQLSLADNGLTNLSALSLAPIANTLQLLDISTNLFTEIPDSLASLVSLRALNLSYCMIGSLHSLGKNPLPAIVTCNLRGNRLTSLAGIERIFSLERLDLRENNLTDPTELARLTGLPNLTEIYVNRNPFTKTHPNYRVTVFNLFRKQPGFTQDIMLDGHLPSYAERKQLIDPAPELPAVPVVRPAPVETIIDRPRPISFSSAPIIQHDPFADKTVPMPHRKKSYKSSQRRKKISKRRVVEIAHEEGTSKALPIPGESPLKTKDGQITDDSTYGGSVDATPIRPRIQTTKDIEEELTPTMPPVADTFNPAQLPRLTSAPEKALPQLPSESEMYKKRIETLRQEFGSAWLSTLTDESWDKQQAVGPALLNSPFAPIGTPAAPVRSASQGIVSTGRTLG
ncbi:hypothetical protein BT63DRAFT_216945 [Microthyrium microscopicum]|uniref:L domain-like protein n=1 Tax=Microthyrium microscopicum TaxID=703497 RepID=A0A6A6UIY3_9PEZI|nr:hypothetical protein BT63DRAFT_216945 [Microthyrium microscopicum]